MGKAILELEWLGGWWSCGISGSVSIYRDVVTLVVDVVGMMPMLVPILAMVVLMPIPMLVDCIYLVNMVEN